MKYKVVVTREAKLGIRESFLYIRRKSPLNAGRWLQGLYQAIDSLDRFPAGYALAREGDYFGETLRQLVYKSHRIIFRIDEDHQVVWVLHVRHTKRLAIGEDAVDEQM